jgi:hypothetical protein
MKRRSASVDAMIQGFDDAISAWVDGSIDSLAETYGVDRIQLLGDLGDRIYHEIELDPAHLKRFIGFYVNDNKMQDLVEEIMSEIPRAASRRRAMTPSYTASVLRRIASYIDKSEAPDSRAVRRELGRVLAAIDGGDEGGDEGPVETVSVNIPKKVDELADEVRKKNPGYTDAQVWGTAWSIYCKNVSPGSEHCKQGEYFD